MIFGNEILGNCFRLLRLEWRIRELKRQLKKSQRDLEEKNAMCLYFARRHMRAESENFSLRLKISVLESRDKSSDRTEN